MPVVQTIVFLFFFSLLSVLFLQDFNKNAIKFYLNLISAYYF
jgi:hypothetical protein